PPRASTEVAGAAPDPRPDGAGSRSPPTPGDRAARPPRPDRRDGRVRRGARPRPAPDLRRRRSARARVCALEGAAFYEHGAPDFPALMRAAITNLIAGDIEQGGSTLTQQLVKNVLIDSPQQTFARKFQEAALAIRVERKYSKDHILELYMNEAYYGNGAYGI